MSRKLVFVLVPFLVFGFVWWKKPDQVATSLELFARCLEEKGVTMYGADWCPHCQDEKREFGDAFQYVPYVECPKEPKRCLDAGVSGYPTWIFQDGKKLVGEQGVRKLSKESRCFLPQGY